jgi:Arc/MetJ-type ribon-helix-helix transcriptional regulator
MTIDISPEAERVVREEIDSGHFRSVDELILSSVRAWREHHLSRAQGRSRANGKEKARDFVEWAKSHPHTPPLSDEAVSRANLNPDRW